MLSGFFIRLAYAPCARYNTLTAGFPSGNNAHMKKDKQSLNISLLSDRVLILPENEKGEQKTATGIIVPVKETENKIEVGTVVAVGTGRRANDGSRVALDVKIGDKVYFKRGYEVEEIVLQGAKYVLLGEMNIYAIIG